MTTKTPEWGKMLRDDVQRLASDVREMDRRLSEKVERLMVDMSTISAKVDTLEGAQTHGDKQLHARIQRVEKSVEGESQRRAAIVVALISGLLGLAGAAITLM
tara:strand:- start:305 stop:613 length:309 start_codon:yes stop_codon:yes gene_type:complete